MGHAFTDARGDRWPVAVTFGDVRRVRAACDFDLLAMFDDGLAGLARLHSDFELLVAVAFSLCEPQADKLGVSADDFASRMAGDTLAEAADAIVEATVAFFPDPRRREALRGLTARIRTLTEKVLTTAPGAALAELDRSIQSLTPEQLASGLNASSGSAAASLASSPGG